MQAIVRIDDDTIELTIPGEVTASLGNSTVTLDFVRTDLGSGKRQEEVEHVAKCRRL